MSVSKRAATVSNSAILPISVAPMGTGFRTHRFRLENRSSGCDPAEQFLIASRLRRWDRATAQSIGSYFTDDITVLRSLLDREPAPEPETPKVALPRPAPLRAGLSDVAMRRRSVRQFRGTPVTLADLGTILRHCVSVTATGETDLAVADDGLAFVTTEFRATASAGGLYPVEVWVAAPRVRGLAPGIYRYLAPEDALAFHDDTESLDALRATLADDGSGVDIDSAAFLALLVARPWRSMRKYGPRGLRFVLHETGAISHGMHLAITAMDIGSVDYSGFHDEESNNVLGLDGIFAALMHVIVAGVP
jgi:SagB-type dehydrogenase family enzyme